MNEGKSKVYYSIDAKLVSWLTMIWCHLFHGKWLYRVDYRFGYTWVCGKCERECYHEVFWS